MQSSNQRFKYAKESPRLVEKTIFVTSRNSLKNEEHITGV